MAAGDVFNGRLTSTTTRGTLDPLAGIGAKTYTFLTLKALTGSVAIGNASVTEANGYMLAPGKEITMSPVSGTVAGANVNLVGPGTVEFFGITSA